MSSRKVPKFDNDALHSLWHHAGMDRIGHKRPKWYVKEWREFRDLTQEQLADRADLTKGTISMFESGKKRLHDDHVAALAFAFGIEPADLLRNPSAPTRDELLRNATPEQAQQIRDFADYVLSRKTG